MLEGRILQGGRNNARGPCWPNSTPNSPSSWGIPWQAGKREQILYASANSASHIADRWPQPLGKNPERTAALGFLESETLPLKLRLGTHHLGAHACPSPPWRSQRWKHDRAFRFTPVASTSESRSTQQLTACSQAGLNSTWILWLKATKVSTEKAWTRNVTQIWRGFRPSYDAFLIFMEDPCCTRRQAEQRGQMVPALEMRQRQTERKGLSKGEAKMV